MRKDAAALEPRYSNEPIQPTVVDRARLGWSHDLYALIPAPVRCGRRFLITINDDGVALSKTTTVS